MKVTDNLELESKQIVVARELIDAHARMMYQLNKNDYRLSIRGQLGCRGLGRNLLRCCRLYTSSSKEKYTISLPYLSFVRPGISLKCANNELGFSPRISANSVFDNPFSETPTKWTTVCLHVP